MDAKPSALARGPNTSRTKAENFGRSASANSVLAANSARSSAASTTCRSREAAPYRTHCSASAELTAFSRPALFQGIGDEGTHQRAAAAGEQAEEQPNDRADRYAHAAYARLAAHDQWVVRDAREEIHRVIGITLARSSWLDKGPAANIVGRSLRNL